MNWKTISLRDLAGYLSTELQKEGIEVVLVGGGCVTIYSQNRYQSYDLDFITYEEMKKVRSVLASLNFVEKNGYFQHADCPWLIEFVAPPIAIGNESVKQFSTVDSTFGKITMLSPTDTVKDRLASYYHWNDAEALKQAVQIYQDNTIDLDEIEQWSAKELMTEKFALFLSHLAD